MIGMLFFASAIFSLTHKNMSIRNKRILFMVFSAALVVSFYSLSFIHLFYIISIFIISRIRGNKKTVSLGAVLFLIAITFSWYMYVSNPPLNKLTEVFQRMVDRFIVDMFEPQARVSSAYTALSPVAQTSIIGLVHKLLVYITHFFIVIGTVILTIKPKEFKFNPEFRLVAILSTFILLLCLGVPNFAPALNFSRFYQIIMLFLAPLFALGGMYFLRLIGKSASPFLRKFSKVSCRDLELRIVTLVLIAFFLFQVGFVNHVTKDYPYSYSLDFNRKKTSTDRGIRVSLYSIYVPEQDFFSAQWLYQNKDNISLVYADGSWGKPVLAAYTLLAYERVNYLFNTTKLESRSYIYLRQLNVREGIVHTVAESFNISVISSLLNQSNKIYSNGESEIYCVP